LQIDLPNANGVLRVSRFSAWMSLIYWVFQSWHSFCFGLLSIQLKALGGHLQ
jgi:hypothetical protein